MARRELGPASLLVARAAAEAVRGADVVVGCSGGADSLALALGAQWAARRVSARVEVVVVDHGLQAGSGEVASGVERALTERGLSVRVERVDVDPAHPGGLEAAARESRLAALAAPGHPVLLGHTLDDQAETVLLGLLRGSGTRAVAGMAPERGPFRRPLLGLRRADTRRACAEWGLVPWEDPMNDDPRFARVAVRSYLRGLTAALDRDVAPALARTADLARADADLLDDLAGRALPPAEALDVEALTTLPPALLGRVVHRWLDERIDGATMRHVAAVEALVTRWRGQGEVAVPGGSVGRSGGMIRFRRA